MSPDASTAVGEPVKPVVAETSRGIAWLIAVLPLVLLGMLVVWLVRSGPAGPDTLGAIVFHKCVVVLQHNCRRALR